MKLIFAVVQNEDANNLSTALTKRGYGTTRYKSTGGFLRQGNVTFLVGVEDDKVDEVIRVIRDNCHTRTQYINPLPPVMEPGEFYMPYPVDVQVGGATVFVLPVERYERL